jgi:mannan endo-1,4-beta-mannosidase
MLHILSGGIHIFLLLSLIVFAKSKDKQSFIQIKENHFVLGAMPYYFAGINFWYGCYLGTTDSGRQRIIRELDFLTEVGITNLRILGASEESTITQSLKPAIQIKPGVFNESLLKGLDFFLSEMGKRKMKAVIFLNNYWEWSGGMSQYVTWFSDDPIVDPYISRDWIGFMAHSAKFYHLDPAQEAFLYFVKKIVDRKNSISGILYKNDPTIMSWELANEPRPGPDGEIGRQNLEVFYCWIQQTAAFIKKLDKNHLVTTGNEGIWGSIRDEQVFLTIHRFKEVDYATFHLWPKNWGWFRVHQPDETLPSTLKNAQAYFNRHAELSGSLCKPFVLEEFGMERDNGLLEPGSPTTARDQFLSLMYDAVYINALQGGMMAGTNVWTWGGFSRHQHDDGFWRPGDIFTGDPPQEAQGLNSIFAIDTTTINILREHSRKMKSLCSKAGKGEKEKGIPEMPEKP